MKPEQLIKLMVIVFTVMLLTIVYFMTADLNGTLLDMIDIGAII